MNATMYLSIPPLVLLNVPSPGPQHAISSILSHPFTLTTLSPGGLFQLYFYFLLLLYENTQAQLFLAVLGIKPRALHTPGLTM
jgi:hypothetical protein